MRIRRLRFSGRMKLLGSATDLEAAWMIWVDGYSANQVKFIGAAEILGASGLIVPAVVVVLALLAGFVEWGRFGSFAF